MASTAARCRLPALLAASIVLFITIPAERAGAGEEKEFRFVVYGGTDGGGAPHRAVVAQIAKLRPELVAHAGGLVGPSANIRQWQAFREAIEPIAAICSFYSCRGRDETTAVCDAREGFPNPPLKAQFYYSFDHRGVHFVFLDSELRVEREDPQTRWLAEDLASAGGKPIVVFLYRAIFGAGGRNVLPNGEMSWHPLFVRHKVRAVFCAARRLYHRTSQDGVAYIITGGGGGTLDPVMARRQLMFGDASGSFNHCIEVTVSADEIRCRVVDTEGKTRDEFLLPIPAKP
jgi:hypothetical protein